MTRTLRRLAADDAAAAIALYADLFDENPVGTGADFAHVIAHPGTSIWAAFEAGALRAMATLHVLPNMTYGGRPYALIENVVTAKAHRGHGHARAVMEAVIQAAWAADAYKIMLLTGRARGAQGFY